MTQLQLAKAMHVASPTISAFERGTRTPRREHSTKADAVLSTGGRLEQLWDELSDTRQIPESWRDFAQLEQQAIEIREYQMALVPGLLQHPDYARYILRQGRPSETDEQVASLVKARTARLADLRHTPLTFVLEEMVFSRVLGSPEIMRSQIDHVMGLIDNRRIRVALVPFVAPLRPALSGAYRIMNLPNGRIVVHIEHPGGLAVLSNSADVNRLVTLFGLQQTEALSLGASLDRMNEIRKALS
ncbi:helix-turn-helix transcriptional regulator [Lipingzhangella sp. LS1_29]|uniref:Helix-turn-helix transcriptional regulator n=1 Tax=Lipingzhangella rawalii TaxID=2055835 RepID=A0ABU2H8G9_9ACTN|nr:helix-turn-helix transcriptional regulator [Lipingzhangella rawalii]MDS1271613.1 helix-turn-helix transcriptional regulator [Lipingzhangella rawalii]